MHILNEGKNANLRVVFGCYFYFGGYLANYSFNSYVKNYDISNSSFYTFLSILRTAVAGQMYQNQELRFVQLVNLRLDNNTANKRINSMQSKFGSILIANNSVRIVQECLMPLWVSVRNENENEMESISRTENRCSDVCMRSLARARAYCHSK